MWTRCLKVVLLLHIADVHSYTYSSGRRGGTSPNTWSRNSSDGVKLRHQGRFANLDAVLGRLNRVKTTTTTPSSLWRSNYSSRKKKKEEIMRNYDDLDYRESDDELDKDEDNAPDYDSWNNEDELKNEDDDYMEEDEEEDYNVQAEEPTYAPSTSLLTQYKWNHYGTRTKVEESRRRQMQQQQQYPGSMDAARAAAEHIMRVNIEGRCSVPRAKVINIQSEHPSPGKRYLPHCTVLHRCSEDTGCCTNPETKCQPKTQTLIHLYFYTNSLGHAGTRIEKLSFQNHTECGCSEIGATPENVDPPPENLRSARSGLSVRSAMGLYGSNTISCNCPEVFIAKRRYDSKCVCDCPNSNLDCINMKRGKEHFSLKERKCIIEEKCGVPSCEYGAYLKSRGRCPRKQEKLDAYASVSTAAARSLN